ncbi:VOC family protein [Halobacillus litoralis]|uniref:VOC family protein n=1 Tax=Halobacillus litoralis TaxID=45668 RepID=UPI001CD5D5AD|nr:VOC family protein [Halobacillus litoralis]MCA1022354.1 VOC family protein [Halobacillus litoralis]
MSRLVHFEIHVDDMERAKEFYSRVFGWTYEDYSEYAGMPYFGAVTGDASTPGINGALMQRQGPAPEKAQPVNSFVCTMNVDNFDRTEALIKEQGGTVAMPKYALPGMAWQGYFHDTEGNLIGIHESDEQAQ